ncbi:MAG: PIN domain-containing protein [Candidatus Methanoperedens sp.]|jgi:predicted nucleic acid-binding protein|nr:PIN domain-containing protein [Candidatus Methanoperedens sp.]
MVYLIDTYAWVEYFLGSERGEKVKEIIEDENNTVITPECCLAEIKGWAIRENLDFEELYRIVRIISSIRCVITKDWLDAASLRSDMRNNMKDFGMIDALIVAQQKRMGAEVVSGDAHFRGLNGVVFV